MTTPAASFSNVAKQYPGGWLGRRPFWAIDQVSFEVGAGEVFGVLGPNRAGKTTLVKILLSLCHATRGRVERFGRPASDRTTLAAIGYVHESQAFPRYLTAAGLLEFYATLNHETGPRVRRRVAELLDRFGLADRSREPIGRFSKGMLQRLALAQALVNDPRLLVLDEPSEGMDLVAQALLRETVTAERRRGRTVILVSHSLADVERLCDRAAVLQSGRLAFLGTLEELAARDSRGSLEMALRRLCLGQQEPPARAEAPLAAEDVEDRYASITAAANEPAEHELAGAAS